MDEWEDRGGYVLIGDLNARTGEMQVVDDGCLCVNDRISESRRSRYKGVNSRGRKLVRLLDDEGFVILNGRMQGDGSGSLTFYGGMGESVIDYACVSMNAIDVVGDFRVDVCDHSHHMLIVVELVCRVEGDGAVVCRDAARLRWNEGFAEGYR